ncbi:MAG: hypothetical protein ACKESB_03285 [Candidatus Hodgkinia cicadicola]
MSLFVVLVLQSRKFEKTVAFHQVPRGAQRNSWCCLLRCFLVVVWWLGVYMLTSAAT